MNHLGEVIAAASAFGLLVVCPIVFMLLRHQRAMAVLLHSQPNEDAARRIASLEQEVRELRNAQHELLIRRDDERALANRGGQR
jgi:hypothetical protein